MNSLAYKFKMSNSILNYETNPTRHFVLSADLIGKAPSAYCFPRPENFLFPFQVEFVRMKVPARSVHSPETGKPHDPRGLLPSEPEQLASASSKQPTD